MLEPKSNTTENLRGVSALPNGVVWASGPIGFAAGNFIVGSVMAVATTLMLWGIGMKGANLSESPAGLLNLLPLLGLIFSPALPLAAALLQFNTPGPDIVITLTILFLHVVSANLLIPKFIATKVEYRAGGGDAGNSLLGLVVGWNGRTSLRCASDYPPQLSVCRACPPPQQVLGHRALFGNRCGFRSPARRLS